METLKYWFPAIAGMLCLGLGAGLIGIYGFFVKPVTEEFGVGATLINLGAVALLLVPGIVSPFVGRLADRVSSRRMVVVGVSIAVASLLLAGFVGTSSGCLVMSGRSTDEWGTRVSQATLDQITVGGTAA